MTTRGVPPLRSNRVPLSTQAHQHLLGLVQNGTYQPGEQLPSQADLATQLGISRATLREALLSLEQQGIIISKHGIGTFVAPGYGERLESGLERLESILELAARQGMHLTMNALEVVQEPADQEAAAALQVAPGTLLTIVRRVLEADQTPIAYMHDMAASTVMGPDDIDDSFDGSVLDLLRNKPDVQIAYGEANIVAINGSPSLAEKLRVEAGQALLLMEEVLFDQEGQVVERSLNYFVPEYYQFLIVRR